MAVKTRSELRAQAQTIRDETSSGANTAARVGGQSEDIVDSVALDAEVSSTYATQSSLTTLETTVDDLILSISVACSDLTSDLSTGTTKGYFRAPFGLTLTGVRSSVVDAPTGSSLVADINVGGVSILSTKLSIDSGEKTSTTATTPPVISSASVTDDAEITFDIDQVGSTNPGKGLIITLLFKRS